MTFPPHDQIDDHGGAGTLLRGTALGHRDHRPVRVNLCHEQGHLPVSTRRGADPLRHFSHSQTQPRHSLGFCGGRGFERRPQRSPRSYAGVLIRSRETGTAFNAAGVSRVKFDGGHKSAFHGLAYVSPAVVSSLRHRVRPFEDQPNHGAFSSVRTAFPRT